MRTQVMTQQITEYFKTRSDLKAWLLGVYSRDNQRADSDVDILIVPDRSATTGDACQSKKPQHFSLFTLSEIYENLKVDIYLFKTNRLSPIPRMT